MKFTVPSTKPRNPLVVAAMRRVAGSHRVGERARRQRLERALHRDLLEMKRIP